MNETLSVVDLKKRWERTLAATEAVVVQHPERCREVKTIVREVATQTLDIGDYPRIVERLSALTNTLDEPGAASIFHLFRKQISPASIGRLKLFRFECLDLLEQMRAFDAWRKETHHLRVLK